MTADILALYKKIKQKKRLREYRKLEILPSDSIYQSLSIERRVMSNHRRVQIGHKSVINGKFIFESRDGEIEIGDRTCIGYATIICRNSVTIGNDVNIAWNCLLYDHDSNSISWKNRKNEGLIYYKAILSGRNIYEDKDWSVVPSEPIKICDKVWIGANVTILKGVTIGEGAVVGIGSVVTHDVPPWTLVAGNPARIIRRIDC